MVFLAILISLVALCTKKIVNFRGQPKNDDDLNKEDDSKFVGNLRNQDGLKNKEGCNNIPSTMEYALKSDDMIRLNYA